MITTAITAGIAAILSFFGVEPGPYLAGVWIGVKIVIVSIGVFIAWRIGKKKKAKDAAELQNGVGPK